MRPRVGDDLQPDDIALAFQLKKLREGLWYRLKRAGLPIYRDDARGQIEGFRLRTTRYPEPGGCFISHYQPVPEHETPEQREQRLHKMEEFVWLYRDILHGLEPEAQPVIVQGEPRLFVPLQAKTLPK